MGGISRVGRCSRTKVVSRRTGTFAFFAVNSSSPCLSVSVVNRKRSLIPNVNGNPMPVAAAIFSPCKKYRYTLRRESLFGEGRVMFLMLNPSTADAVRNDPTVRRCMGYAREWGFRELVVGNLFALRSTDPSKLYEVTEPIGELNDEHLLREALLAELVVAAWGVHGKHLDRGARVAAMLGAAGVTLQCLGHNANGSPRHPLYVPGGIEPMAYEPWKLAGKV